MLRPGDWIPIAIGTIPAVRQCVDDSGKHMTQLTNSNEQTKKYNHLNHSPFVIKIMLPLVFILFDCKSFSQSGKPNVISKMEWLVGSWKGHDNNKPFYEAWRKTNDGTLENFSIDISNSDTVIKEQTTIIGNDTSAILSKRWLLKRLTGNEIMFENDTMSFSNRIIWLHTKEDHWFTILQHPKSTAYYDMIKIPELDILVDKFIEQKKK